VTFSQDTFAENVPENYLEAFATIWTHLAMPGDWFDAETRIRLATETRSDQGTTYDLGQLNDDELLLDTVRRITQDPAKLHRDWFDTVTGRLGLGPYAEAVAIVTQVVPIDRFCKLLGRPLEPLPHPIAGAPSRKAPDDLVDRGAWLPMSPMPGANVVAALSYVPLDNLLRLGLVRALYSGTNFDELQWTDRALSRPQIELLATQTSAHNECFY
jgi:hypothetical protein